MPTLTRILGLLAVIAAIAYGAMFALANFVEPTRHIITVEIPASNLKQTVIEPPLPPVKEEPDDLSGTEMDTALPELRD